MLLSFLIFSHFSFLENIATSTPQMSLIMVKAFYYEGKEMKALDDDRIVDLYLGRDEAAILQTSEKYGSRLRNLAYCIVEDSHTAEISALRIIRMPLLPSSPILKPLTTSSARIICS